MNMATFENNPVIEFVAHFVPPFQGLNLNAMIPRALPWAVMCCAFSAGDSLIGVNLRRMFDR
jgi:hypothetical protein